MRRQNNFDVNEAVSPTERRKWDIVWDKIILYVVLHLGAAYGMYLYSFKILWLTLFYVHFLCLFSGLGITAGAHRLWTRRSYKARLPLEILLIFMNTMAMQAPVKYWSRDHRLHHKFSDTDADPYNAKRGFFFSHIGWLNLRKHPEVKAKGKLIDISDLKNNPILKFQERYYFILAAIACYILPTYVATLWGESAWNAFFTCSMFRHVVVLHKAFLVNSFAHLWGNKPYDKNIRPVENKIVSFFAYGEGFHNFHHTFPWDYKTGELGAYTLNLTTLFIDIMAAIGWAYDLKFVTDDVVQKRIERTGDRSHLNIVMNFQVENK